MIGITTDEIRHAPYERYNVVSRWPLHYLPGTRQFMVQLGTIHIAAGRHWVPVLDVTAVAPRLQLNNGSVPDDWADDWADAWLLTSTANRVGEVYALVGSEGRYAHVVLADGSTHQIDARRQLAVDVSIPTS